MHGPHPSPNLIPSWLARPLGGRGFPRVGCLMHCTALVNCSLERLACMSHDARPCATQGSLGSTRTASAGRPGQPCACAAGTSRNVQERCMKHEPGVSRSARTSSRNSSPYGSGTTQHDAQRSAAQTWMVDGCMHVCALRTSPHNNK